ncbi:phage tail protein [Candidatus Saccharibacteria bacterium]|nr:phage tail protein [Candidatus Saccharibacteria bacterium]
MIKIKTINGDTWDLIAYRIWGKGADQTQMAALYEANPEYSRVTVFRANIELRVPAVGAETPLTIPPWRR